MCWGLETKPRSSPQGLKTKLWMESRRNSKHTRRKRNNFYLNLTTLSLQVTGAAAASLVSSSESTCPDSELFQEHVMMEWWGLITWLGKVCTLKQTRIIEMNKHIRRRDNTTHNLINKLWERVGSLHLRSCTTLPARRTRATTSGTHVI